MKQITFDDLTPDQFKEEIGKLHNRLIMHDLKRAKIQEVEGQIPVYFWMVDDKKAVFSIPYFYEEFIENGFYTKDPILIDALQSTLPKN